MKRTITFLGMLFITICLASCGPTKEDAIKYSDAITAQQIKVVDAENKLIGETKKGAYRDLDRILNELSVQIDSSAAIVKKMEAFDGKTDLKDATTALLTVYRTVVDNEYKAWMANLNTPEEMIDDRVLNEEKVLIKSINDKLNKANDDFKRAQRTFADTYKFVLSSY